MTGRRPVSGPAGEAKPDVCAFSDGEAGAYCTVGPVFLEVQHLESFSPWEKNLILGQYFLCNFCLLDSPY